MASWSQSVEGFATSDERNFQPYHKAQERVHRRLHFFQHVAIFGSLMVVLLVVDGFHHIFLGNGEVLVPWVAGIWGVILAAHFIHAFFLGDLVAGTERRLVEREERRLGESFLE